MARANLVVSNELKKTFENAQDAASNIRLIKVTIEGESLTVSLSRERINKSAETDWDAVLLGSGVIEESKACIVLYCLTDEVRSIFSTGSLSIGSESKKWCLICWIPDSEVVRNKMLYTSSREDLKKSLGR